MARRQPPPGYYGASVARRKLSTKIEPITPGKLKYYVDQGKIERFVPPESSQGFYKKEDVDRLAKSFQAFYGQQPNRIQFKQTIASEDVAECLQIDKEIYGSPGVSAEKRLLWLEKNPELLYVLKSERVVGYVSILPLKREKIDGILREELYLRDITVEDIQTFEPRKPLDTYIMSVAIRPEQAFDMETKRLLASQLVGGLMNKLLEWGKRGVVFQNLLARSRFADGIRMLTELGFKNYPMAMTPDERFSYFILEVDTSDSLFIRRYKRALEKVIGGRGND